MLVEVASFVGNPVGDRTCMGEAGKKHATCSLKDQRISNRQNSTKLHKNWGLLVLAQLLNSSDEKRFFLLRYGFGLTMKKMTTYSCRVGWVNLSFVSFTVRRELKSF